MELLNSDCSNMPSESFDSNWPQITTGQHSDKWKIAIYDPNYSEKRAKKSVIISHFKQNLCIMLLISLSNMLELQWMPLKEKTWNMLF